MPKHQFIDVHFEPLSNVSVATCALCGSSKQLGRVTGGLWQGGIIICFEHSFQFCFDLAESMAVALEQIEEERNGSGLS